MSFDYKNTDQIVKAMGKHKLVLADPKTGFQVETPLTLAELIHYIQVTGACASSPYDAKEIKEMGT